MTDLNQAIFKSDIYGNVNSFRQNLQLEYTNMLISLLNGKLKEKYEYPAKSIKTMAAATGNTISRAHKQHLKTLIDNAIEDIK